MDEALAMARKLSGLVGMFKINIHLFTAAGPEAVRKIGSLGDGIFLDLKYHDIPNTVAGAVRAACGLPGVRLLNLHTTGGLEMMRAGAEALAQSGGRPNRSRPQLLGVTVLTSLDRKALNEVGMTGTPKSRVLDLARLAKRAGLDGVVASPQEVSSIRKACGKQFLIVVPGVRPATGDAVRSDDQARIATPAQAVRSGADYLVIGRPIIAASDPAAAARAIAEEVASALRPA